MMRKLEEEEEEEKEEEVVERATVKYFEPRKARERERERVHLISLLSDSFLIFKFSRREKPSLPGL